MIASGIVLRDYQRDAVAAVEHAFSSGQRRTLLVLPTGAGKTIVFGHVVRTITATDDACALVLVHTEELIEQAERALRSLLPKIEIGIVRAHQDETDAQVIVGSVQTLRSRKRLQRIGQFDLIVIDEAHHSVAPTYRMILEELGAFDAARCHPLMLGVTATADRGDGQGLGAVFQSIAYEVGIDEMIQRGYLSDIRAKRVVLDMDLDRVRRRGDDFADGALGSAMMRAGAPWLIAKAIRLYAADRKSVVFVPTVAVAERTAAAISALGIPARAVSGRTPRKERKRIIEDVRAGRLQVVTNAMVLTEGFDAPVLDCAVMARPTSSRALYQQSSGRVLRPYFDKQDALILDVVGVTARHSLHTAASLIDALPEGERIGDGETAMDAVQRVRESQQVAAFTPADGRLVAFDVDVFDRSRLNWITSVVRLPVLSGARTAYAIRMGAEDTCELFQLDVHGHGYRAMRIAEGLSIDLAQGMAEDAARRSGFDVLTLREQAWRNDPATTKQHSKLWAMGVRDRDVLRGIRTKGEAADRITQFLAEQAIQAYDAEIATVSDGEAA